VVSFLIMADPFLLEEFLIVACPCADNCGGGRDFPLVRLRCASHQAVEARAYSGA
jgi:hypothetical protein